MIRQTTKPATTNGGTQDRSHVRISESITGKCCYWTSGQSQWEMDEMDDMDTMDEMDIVLSVDRGMEPLKISAQPAISIKSIMSISSISSISTLHP